MPQTFGPSQLDGYDFTRIKAFSDQYYIAVPSNPNNGDTLVFNAGTGLWEAQSNLFRFFSAYHHAGGTAINTTGVDLAYDKEVRKDSGYSHTISTAGITVTSSGLYCVQADIGVAVSSWSTNSYISIWLT